MKNLKLMITVLVAIALLCAGCAPASQPSAEAPAGQGGASAVEKIKAAGKLVMLTNAGFAPYEFLGDDNSIIGVDVEIAAAISAGE